MRVSCAILALLLDTLALTPAKAEIWFQETPLYTALATDPGGSLYAAGSFAQAKLAIGTVDLENHDASGKTEDAIIAKYNDLGKVLWAKRLGGAAADALTDIAADAAGNVYAVGTAAGTWITPPTTAVGTSDALVVKLDTGGNLLWAKRFGGAGAAMTAAAVTTDGSGNILVSGTFAAADTTTPPMTKRGLTDAFVIKLDPAGNVVWSANFGGGGTTMSTAGLTADQGGNVYLTAGFTGNTPSFPPLPVNARPSFVMKIDASGSIGWTAAPSTQWTATLYDVGVDSGGDAYVAGLSESKLVLWKLTGAGGTVWLKDNASQNAGTTYPYPTRLSVENNVVYIGGYDVVSMIITGFVAAFDKDGTRISWQKYWGRNSGEAERSPTRVLGLASDSRGSFYFSANGGGLQPRLPTGAPYLAKYPASATADTASPVPQTGWWYNPSQTGRGIAIEYYRASGRIFMGAFAYDAAGAATWQVGVCTYDVAAKSCTGTLDTYRDGATIGDLAHAPATFTGGAGKFTFTFTDSRNGTLSWKNEQFPITRFRPTTTDGTDTAGNASFYTGWYWDPTVPGRGYFLESWKNADGSVPLYGVGFMYRQDGSPVWYVMQGVAPYSNPTSWDQLPFVEFAGGSPSFVGGNWTVPDRTQQIAAYPLSMLQSSYSTVALMPSTGKYIPMKHFVQ